MFHKSPVYHTPDNSMLVCAHSFAKKAMRRSIANANKWMPCNKNELTYKLLSVLFRSGAVHTCMELSFAFFPMDTPTTL